MNGETKKLSVCAWAVTAAILWGLYLLLLGLLTMAGIETLWVSKEVMDILAPIYPGFSATLGGSFIGLAWGLLCGAICGGLFSGLHNIVLSRCYRGEK